MTRPFELAAPHAVAVLSALIARDSRQAFTLEFAQAAGLVPALSGRAVDDVLLEARETDLIVGDRGEGDGSVCWWSRVRLPVAGLRWLGQWPPAGREWEPGDWDNGLWGRRARPRLVRLHEAPPQHGFYFKPIGEGSEAWLDWTALLALGEAGLVSGRESESGVDTLRLTASGQRALDPTPCDPLEEATAKLRTGARVDAIVTAVERALAGRLTQLAAKHGAATTRPDGSPLNLNAINTNLRGAGVYGESDRAQVEAWLKVRNDLAHANPTVPSDARVEAVIAGIRAFLDDNPL
jgi:hypothetical protein